jgi:hypothetical protein
LGGVVASSLPVVPPFFFASIVSLFDWLILFCFISLFFIHKYLR